MARVWYNIIQETNKFLPNDLKFNLSDARNLSLFRKTCFPITRLFRLIWRGMEVFKNSSNSIFSGLFIFFRRRRIKPENPVRTSKIWYNQSNKELFYSTFSLLKVLHTVLVKHATQVIYSWFVRGNQFRQFQNHGHPTTVFCKISVRRNKYCLEISVNLRKARKFLDDCSIHVQFSLPRLSYFS